MITASWSIAMSRFLLMLDQTAHERKFFGALTLPKSGIIDRVELSDALFVKFQQQRLLHDPLK
jgi:hypothetical protein